MDIWIIRNGKKSGPLPDYEIRSRILDGQLTKDDYVWHEELPGWVPLEEIELFHGDLKRAEREQKSSEKKDEKSQEKPVDVEVVAEELVKRMREISDQPQKEKRHLGRRFWARWLDLTVYTAVWWLLMYVVGRDIGAAIRNPWLQLSVYFPWFAIEAWIIHRFGITPGKWLLDLRVVNEDESKLSLKASIWRSIRVLITGVGFGWGLLSVLCQGMSWFTTKRLGKPVWDYLGGHKVEVTPLRAHKVIVLVGLIFIAAHLQMAVRGPHEQEIILERYPSWKEFFENRNNWYFPVKNQE